MNAQSPQFQPGDLVFARGREWVVLPSPDTTYLCLRPLSGAESDVRVLDPALEPEPVRHASFGAPPPSSLATQDAARLLSDALRLSLRRGAGPFRCAGRLSFEPRPYQLVPLLLALRLAPVRLLIADDVGIGKTIEAALIVRELMDRGEIDRFAVLCPPHLVEQWTMELRSRFHIDAVAVTASTAARLERGLPASQSLFDAHPYTVVSLDYIKAEKRRESFARSCPLTVIVDEAHACTGTHLGRQQRFALLELLAADRERHLILLSATPHSGDEHAFDRLLSLLDPSFSSASLDDDAARRRLARHLVQRRRVDIMGQDWGETRAFPRHETTEHTYRFNTAHQAFHDAVLDFCLGASSAADAGRRLAYRGTLTLMRCVGSSPAAALSALRNLQAGAMDVDALDSQLLDDDSIEATDLETAAGIPPDAQLQGLMEQAERLLSTPDPKLQATATVLEPLIREGANPVIFCRFLATAAHVAEGLRRKFPQLRIECVTGELPAEERRARVDDMAEAPQRLLVATDCLSEGINLQSLFDTVLHYDLSWNPTRHQQREGRVDRFGQPAPLVRSILLYSADSAIDGAVLSVILRKADAIRRATGVTVPLPEQRGAVVGALMKALYLRRQPSAAQLSLDLRFDQDEAELEARWRDAMEGEARSRARFAQNAIRPQEILPEFHRWREILGGPAEIERFLGRALARLNSALDLSRPVPLAHLHTLPSFLVERLAVRSLAGSVALAFTEPPPPRAQVITRGHPLTGILAEALLESALDAASPLALAGLAPLGRTGAWRSSAVRSLTTLLLLRLRFQLTVHARRERLLLVEEAAALAFPAAGGEALAGPDAFALFEVPSSGSLAEPARDRMVQHALTQAATLLAGPVADYARTRAAALAEDHARLRSTGVEYSRISVAPVLPADLIGVFSLVPDSQ